MRHLVLVLLTACGSGGTPAATPTPAPPQPVPPASQPTADAVSGYWTGDWGKLVLKAQGDKIVGAYSHDEGIIVGTLQGNTLVGWWCEVPSRKPSKDAGDVEMKFITNDEGKRAIDGRWRYGNEGNWREDWDIAWDASAPPEELTKRLADAATQCAK